MSTAIGGVVWGELSVRERDALVAARVLGAEITGPHTVQYPNGRADYLPQFTTNIAAAWEVVEKMESVELCPLITHKPGEYWEVELWPVEPGAMDPAGAATAPAAPEAICIAALRACGVEVSP